MPYLLVILLVMFMPQASRAAPSFDCAKASSSAEELVCKDDALAALDNRLAERFAAATAAARALDSGADAAVAELRATQRGWIGGRDECWKTENVRDCVENSYLRREAELVATWMLEPAMASQSWTCAGNPSNVIFSDFFDTELPAVRLEYGDSVDVGTLVRAASGSRYVASFGREFWIKGDEARLTWPEGQEQTCIAAK